MKKGQSEIVGLLVIVVILIFMGLIYLSFSNLADTGALASQRSNLETENALKSLMKMDLGDELSIKELIVICGTNGDCNGLETELEDIFEVIIKPGKQFSFWIEMEETQIFAIGHCDLGLVSSNLFVKNGIYYEAKLKVC